MHVVKLDASFLSKSSLEVICIGKQPLAAFTVRGCLTHTALLSMFVGHPHAYLPLFVVTLNHTFKRVVVVCCEERRQLCFCVSFPSVFCLAYVCLLVCYLFPTAAATDAVSGTHHKTQE